MAEVTIYTRQLCGFCTAAKKLLTEKKVEFIENDATHSDALRSEMIKRSEGGMTFPQIFIGDIHIGGCDDLFALERSGQLDGFLKL